MIKLQILPERIVQMGITGEIVKTGEPILIPKAITENGTYAASDDGANGYNSVTVNVDMDQAYDKGKQEEYDRFWDTYQECGNRTDYDYAFYYGWTQENFKPKYKMVPTKMIRGFSYLNIPDFVNSCELDTSQCVDMAYALSGPGFEHIGVIDLSSCTDGCHGLFSGSVNLHTVDKIIYHEGVTRGELFYNCPNLVNLTIEGTIACDYKMNYCGKLSAQSVQSIINALKDFAGTGSEYTKTLTFNAAVGKKLTDAQKATITAKNWTLVY